MENTNPSFDPVFYQFEPGSHEKKRVIWIRFPYRKDLVQALRQTVRARWSRSEKAWYVTDTTVHRNLFGLPLNVLGRDWEKKISPENFAELEKFRSQLVLKAYAPNTLRTYCSEFAQLLQILGTHSVKALSPERLQSYFLFCHQELKHSENQIHSRMNAVKFYFERVLHRDKMFFDIPRPKKPALLPKTLNKKEISRLFQSVENPRHLLVLKLGYGMGLRVSEIAALKIEHIDGESRRVLIQQSKGKKDRYVNLPASVLQEMRDYYKKYRPQVWLFEGTPGHPYAIRTIQAIFKTAMKKSGINKNVGIHGLRHSYATHLLECGTDIRIIKELLGHNSIKTTEIYTQVTDLQKSRVRSPLDDL